ncbi:MAG: transposase [Erysipelotrichaceae bacterium]|nr:transposase [Erysipelotrichaceae bacterium]
MESDKDHIPLLISYSPDISITSIVRMLKQISIHQLWNKFQSSLRKCFWKEHTLCVLLVKPILILYANKLKIRVNGTHPID